VLRDSLGVFECATHAVHEGGDHHILVGEVLRASFDSTLDPLLYFRGKYRRLHFD
jgi:flavin reductase (DIM6/NTAB) family NADH-FMN oxidoreductase RutF